MENSYYLAVDLGATSGRTVSAKYNDQKIEMEELTRFRNPMIPVGGHLFRDIAGLYHEVLLGLKKMADEGRNTIEVRVANVWVNRIIGDEQPDNPERITHCDSRHYRADSPLNEAGFLGPVTVTAVK